jgi:hypothetical protein
MKMSGFIGKMFQARDVAHSAHLNSQYAKAIYKLKFLK